MGYDYGFHLVLVKPPLQVAKEAVVFVEGDQQEDFPIETFAKEVVAFCVKFAAEQNYEAQGFWFPSFGEKFHAGNGSYSCGNHNNDLQKAIKVIGEKFPEAVFALHHYYWDMTNLTVYTFQGDKILEETSVDFENYMVGSYKICMHLDFLNIAMAGNMSAFFNEDYGYEFDFRYEDIYKAAGILQPGGRPHIAVVQVDH